MVTTPFTDLLCERLQALLSHHEQLQKSHARLQAQIATLTHERDSLQARLTAARARVDMLIERLPKTVDQDEA